MRQSAARSLLCASFAWTMLFGCNQAGLAQAPADTPPTEVEFVQLSSPVYPPLARQVRIIGDVKIHIKIRPDGSVASAEVIDGHPMLGQAPLESAQKSTYQCLGCKEQLTSYSLTYTFGALEGGPDCTVRRLRSQKCLYLWQCGPQTLAEPHRPAMGRSPGHITILAEVGMCVEPEASR